MTTVEIGTIAPDSALVINPGDLGSSATGVELEKLFVAFTKRHSQSPWQFELSPEGKIIIMAPTYYPGSMHENAASSALFLWAMDFGGVATGPTAAYRLPRSGGVVAPDAAWTSADRWESHTHVAGEPIAVCPDFVIEIRSSSDNLAPLHAKMRLYNANGTLLGWLIDARNRRVYIYRAGQPEPELLENPATLAGEDVLPGFTFEVARWIFDRS
ncbi:MAG: Uma2 family endonuclease [Chloroflexota bacterium]|nr:Uma2 family endonuclease [Chloroflexota bacterium]MDE2962029.1 Uma2 family endonuclease [Chloroflexota bacterium]